MKCFRNASICAVMLLVGISPVLAQTFQGTLRGAVRDANGVIPGVTVQLVNEETGVSREVVSNDVGEYSFPAIQPGSYSIKASLAGFKTYENKGVRIGTAQSLTLDVRLEVGAIEETLTVTGEAPLIDTSNASTGETLDRQQLEALPAPGRAAFLIGVTVPTVIATGDSQFNRQQDQTNASLVSLGGGARRANNYILDGVSISDMRNRAVVNPTIEGIEEVKVQVYTFDAEMGRTGGGVFNSTAKSGTNNFRGSGFFQTRPVWGQQNNYFSNLAGQAKPTDLYYRLYGAGVGGPVLRNRTFFHFATEGYRSSTTRNGALIFPTSRERRGDFWQTFDTSGNLIIMYNPVTRLPFAGNVVPGNRIDPVGQAIVNLLPTPGTDVSNQRPNYNRVARIVDAADQFMTKIDHKFLDNWTLSGLHIYNKTDEPFAIYWDTNTFQDPNATPLRRRIQVVGVNNTFIPNDTTVMTLRYGSTRFNDDCVPATEFNPKTLGFDSAFTNGIISGGAKHPIITMDGYGEVGLEQFDTHPRNDISWKSWSANATYSKLLGSHTFKAGADYMNMGLDTTPFGASSGTFDFTARFTGSATGQGGNSLASLLLGLPRTGSADITSASEYFLNYFGGYVQDDWRVKPNLTVNYGLRLEHEQGLQEKNNLITVGFDQSAVSPLSGRVPGLGQINGGLIYAGVGGANTYQGDPPAVKVSPRVGMVYSMSPTLVLRGGYGMFWAPWNYQFPGTTNYGNRGFTAVTTLVQSSDAQTGQPTVLLRNPFPGGLAQPTGSSLGLLTGTGSTIDVIDQTKTAPRIQQASFDLQKELPNNMAVSVGFAHSRGDDLGYGGTVDAIVNANQIQNTQGLTPAQLTTQVPNPFFGVAGAGGFGGVATVQRGQLLRPFPQFGDVNLRQTTGAKSRYNAVILKFDKRVNKGWGGRFNYTWSKLKDSQFGETNHFQSNTVGRPQDNRNLDGEYATGLLDTPHRIVLAPIIELPFGQGKRWATSGLGDYLVGGWTISAVASIESGFPTPVRVSAGTSQANTGNFGTIWLRANYTSTDPNGVQEVVGTTIPWATAAGYSIPGVGTLGTEERTDTRLRSQMRKNLDMVFTKAVRTGGSTRAEVRIEMLNLTNTPKYRDYNTFMDQTTFGIVSRQSGFSRITQLSFRFTF